MLCSWCWGFSNAGWLCSNTRVPLACKGYSACTAVVHPAGSSSSHSTWHLTVQNAAASLQQQPAARWYQHDHTAAYLCVDVAHSSCTAAACAGVLLFQVAGQPEPINEDTRVMEIFISGDACISIYTHLCPSDNTRPMALDILWQVCRVVQLQAGQQQSSMADTHTPAYL